MSDWMTNVFWSQVIALAAHLKSPAHVCSDTLIYMHKLNDDRQAFAVMLVTFQLENNT